MKKFRAFFLLAFAMIFIAGSLTSCKKWKAKRRLDGTWNVTSYTQDGEELIGSNSFYSSVKFRFTPDDKESGDVEITIVDNVFGGTTVDSGTYQCNDDEIVFTVTDDDGTFIYTYDMELEKEEMTLSGNIDGYAEVIKAEKE